MMHLNDDQIARCLASDASPESVAHLSICTECSTRLARTHSTFTALRDTLTAASMAPVQATSGRRANSWRYALVAATLALVVIPIYYRAQPQVISRISSAAPSIDDDTLLRDIETEVSRPVTPSLERLELLMVSESTARQ